MRKLFTITCSLLVIAGAAFAQWQPGSLDITSDVGGTDCNLGDAPPFQSIYVFHTNTNGSTLARYRVNPSGGVTATWLADNTAPYQSIGSSPAGIATAYGACVSGSFLINTMTYITSGNIPACETLQVVEDPTSTSGQVEFIDCSLPVPVKATVPVAGTAIFNNDGSCQCNIPVRDTTWGKVKRLYN